jgi:hypothetical protein
MQSNILMATAMTTAVAGASAGAARADLTISGAVGLPLNPTAQIPERGSVRVQANFSDLAAEPASQATGATSTSAASTLRGVWETASKSTAAWSA